MSAAPVQSAALVTPGPKLPGHLDTASSSLSHPQNKAMRTSPGCVVVTCRRYAYTPLCTPHPPSYRCSSLQALHPRHEQVVDAGALSAELVVLQPQRPDDPPSVEVRYTFESQESYDAYGNSTSHAAFLSVFDFVPFRLFRTLPHSLSQLRFQSRASTSRRRWYPSPKFVFASSLRRSVPDHFL